MANEIDKQIIDKAIATLSSLGKTPMELVKLTNDKRQEAENRLKEFDLETRKLLSDALGVGGQKKYEEVQNDRLMLRSKVISAARMAGEVYKHFEYKHRTMCKRKGDFIR